MKCKWLSDDFNEICVNDECPVCCDFCPCTHYPEICKFAEESADNKEEWPLNKIFITGNVVETPVVKTTQSGINTTNFKVAVQRSFANKNGERESDFFTVVAWRGTADFCGRYLTKGRKVAIEGQMQNRNYIDKNNQKHYVWELIADNVEPCDRRESNGNNANAPQQNQQQSYSAPVEQEEANTGGNFEEVQDDDLPFE